MKSILAAKKNMSQVFDESGKVVPVTLAVFKKEVSEEEIDSLQEGDKIQIVGTTKGKGFQGVVKRHGFKGGSRTHGQKHSEREAGSIGGGGRAGGRVVKGMKMAGRMGGKRRTITGLKIVSVDKEKREVMISGAVPGHRGTVLEIKKS